MFFYIMIFIYMMVVAKHATANYATKPTPSSNFACDFRLNISDNTKLVHAGHNLSSHPPPPLFAHAGGLGAKRLRMVP